MTEETRLVETQGGLAPTDDGWFVVNVRESVWVTSPVLGDAGIFENEDLPAWPQLGFTIAVLRPGQSGGRYHGESNQEDFLVLSGECLLLIEGEERGLRAWDFVHCPAWAEHVFVGAGDGPCAVLAIGGRSGGNVIYPESELAQRHKAGVEKETTSSPREAYAPFPRWEPGRPSFDGLPWG